MPYVNFFTCLHLGTINTMCNLNSDAQTSLLGAFNPSKQNAVFTTALLFSFSISWFDFSSSVNKLHIYAFPYRRRPGLFDAQR